MSMSAEEAQQRIAQLEDRVNQLLLRATSSEDEHRRTHAELERVASLATALPGHAGGDSREFRLIDPKSMIPDKLGSASGPQWRGWSEQTRAYVEMLSEKLADQLKAVEGIEQPLLPDWIEEAAVPRSYAAQMSRYLKLRTEGNANTIVKAAQARKEHPLEQWRRLSWEHDPKGLGSELIELNELVSPDRLRAKTMAGIGAAIEAWEEQERRHKDRQGVELPEKIRIAVLFRLAPKEVSEEIPKQSTKWSTYRALKDHLQTLQFLRTNGPAPMLSNIEEQDGPETVTTEDGEILRLERRDGKKVAVRANQRRGAKGDGKGNTDCYACGRAGHRRADCTWAKHKDGGPIRPPPKRRPAGNLEDADEEAPSVPAEKGVVLVQWR